MVLFESIIRIVSWFESLTNQVMYIFCAIREPFEPHNRVDVSHRVFNIPHYFPVHHESEVVVGIDDCAGALRELGRVVVEFDIPVNYGTEVRLHKITHY